MKPLSFYSQKKKDKFLWIPVILTLFLMVACGPTREEIEAHEKEQQAESEMRHTSIATDNCGCSDFTATYYSADSCEYIGKLDNSSSDFMAHSGQCKRCEKRQIYLTDSIVKANLKSFFAIEKK